MDVIFVYDTEAVPSLFTGIRYDQDLNGNVYGFDILFRFLNSISYDWRIGLVHYDGYTAYSSPDVRRLMRLDHNHSSAESIGLEAYTIKPPNPSSTTSLGMWQSRVLQHSYEQEITKNQLQYKDMYHGMYIALNDGTWRNDASRLIVYVTGQHDHINGDIYNGISLVDILELNNDIRAKLIGYNLHYNQTNEILMREMVDHIGGKYARSNNTSLAIYEVCDHIGNMCGLVDKNCEIEGLDVTWLINISKIYSDNLFMITYYLNTVTTDFDTRTRIFSYSSGELDLELDWLRTDSGPSAGIVVSAIQSAVNKYASNTNNIPPDGDLYQYYINHNSSWRSTASKVIVLVTDGLRYSYDIISDMILDARLKKIRYFILQTASYYTIDSFSNYIPSYLDDTNLVRLAESTDGVLYKTSTIVQDSLAVDPNGHAAEFVRKFNHFLGYSCGIRELSELSSQSAQKLHKNSANMYGDNESGVTEITVGANAYSEPVVIDMNDGRYIITIKSTTLNIDNNYSVPIVIEYNRNNTIKQTKFLNKGTFDSEIKVNDIYSGLTTVFEHSGGQVKFRIDAQFFSDISGEVNLIINRDNEYDIENSNIQKIQSDDNLTCVMNSNKIRWYEKGWKENRGCGCVISISGQDYIVIKRSIGDDSSCGGGESISSDCIKSVTDKYGHPAIAWPTFDGFNFVNVPNADVVFKFDKKYNDVSLTLINNGMYEKHIGHVQNIGCVIFPVQ